MSPTLDADAFVRHLAAGAPPPLRGWADDARLLAGAREFLAPLAERLDDDALAASFFGHCPIPGARAEDYRTRALILDGHGPIWAGIRFKGGDVAHPFVEVATAFPLTPEALRSLGPLLAAVFAVFRPRALRAWRFEADGEPAWPESVPDQIVYAAPIAAMSAGDRPAPPGFHVARATDLAWYDTFAADFAASVGRDPVLADEIRFETRDDLAACLEAGLLFEARLDGALAGIFAVAEDSFFGLPGLLVCEEYLLASCRGRGLGAWLQRLAAERLPAERVLFGTIHALNGPSRGTAAANGRVPLLQSHFVPLPVG